MIEAFHAEGWRTIHHGAARLGTPPPLLEPQSMQSGDFIAFDRSGRYKGVFEVKAKFPSRIGLFGLDADPVDKLEELANLSRIIGPVYLVIVVPNDSMIIADALTLAANSNKYSFDGRYRWLDTESFSDLQSFLQNGGSNDS